MISEKQKLILKLLVGNKDGYNVNQIARLLNISVGWVHESLKLLEKQSLLKTEKIKNGIFYKINWKNPKAVKLSEFILIEELEKIPRSAVVPNVSDNVYKIIEKDVAEIIRKEIIEGKAEFSEENKENPIGSKYGLVYSPASSDRITNIYNVTNLSNPESSSRVPGTPYAAGGGIAASGSVYGVTPVSQEGVSGVLGMYGSSGLGSPVSSAYAAASSAHGQYGSKGAASPGTIEATVSSLVGNYNFAQHTAHLSGGNVQGCRYCGTV